ncbi:hypothetical protein NKJ28_08035 [Mesorhizobium sp. M0145]|uniref:hypothetical protein n=1 Tax=Mesorhizobium sp. M0145 TaxID=2956895 RepID=UPI0033368601
MNRLAERNDHTHGSDRFEAEFAAAPPENCAAAHFRRHSTAEIKSINLAFS